MKLFIISGSHREKSNSIKIAEYIKFYIKEHDFGFNEVDIANLYDLHIPFWSEELWSPDDGSKSENWKDWSRLSGQLQASDAFIFICPEYGGMVPPKLKNLFLLCGPLELGHKPALLASVSASINGAYPIAELRMTAFKNNHVCFLPDHLIFRNAGDIFTKKVIDKDDYMTQRLHYSLNILSGYSEALKPFRGSDLCDLTSYPFGM